MPCRSVEQASLPVRDRGKTEFTQQFSLCRVGLWPALALRLPHMKKRNKSLAILYSLGDAINIVYQTNTGRARK